MSNEWAETRPASLHPASKGEHMSRIAANYGYRSYVPIWMHAENAKLRASRQTPHILAAGDRVFIPAVEPREVDKATEKRHRFRASVRALVLRVVRQEWDGSPFRDTTKSVALDGKPTEFTAKPDGVEVPIEPLSKSVTIVTAAFKVADPKVPPRDDATTDYTIGFLQPVLFTEGFRERLNNLGYRAGTAEDPTDLAIRSAVEEFQCDHALPVDGKCGPATQKKLVQVHGC